MSHELRTPLGLIKVASTTLQRSDVTFPPTVQQEILRGITDESNRVELLVSNLLDLSWLEQKRFVLHRAPTDVRQSPDHSLAAVHEWAGEARGAHHFHFALPDAPILAEIDAPKIEQVLRNLLQNAVHYSPDGGAVTVALRADAVTWELRVADEGIGIAPEDRIALSSVSTAWRMPGRSERGRWFGSRHLSLNCRCPWWRVAVRAFPAAAPPLSSSCPLRLPPAKADKPALFPLSHTPPMRSLSNP